MAIGTQLSMGWEILLSFLVFWLCFWEDVNLLDLLSFGQVS
jgi:hypothetical protein